MLNGSKQVLIFLILVSFGSIYCDYEFPAPQVKFYQNGGFEVSIPKDERISLFAFHGRKNMELDGTEVGTWNMDISKPTGNRLMFREANARFNIGDRLHYWLYVVYEGLGYELLYQMTEVKKFDVRPSGLQKTTYEFSQPQIHFMNPRGFKVSLAAEDGMTLMAFHGQINEPFLGRTGGTFSKDITKATNGEFVFKDLNTKLKRGDRLYFWLYVIYKGLGYHLEDKYYDYRGDEIQLHNPQIHFPSSDEYTTQNTIDVRQQASNPTTCPPSISMVNGMRNFCAGEEIFFEEFKGSFLDNLKWSIERRMAVEPDYEFVLYSNESFATGGRGGLKIEPKLLTDVFGAESLRMDLVVDSCTAPVDSMACKFDKQFTRTLPPPIVSSQITTSGKFSFLFGRIEIEAKMPTGDWIYPQLRLQPQGFKYDKTDYKAGMVNLGQIVNIPNLNSHEVKIGVILGSEEPIRSQFLNTKNVNADWTRDFHKFVVEWKPEGFSFWIDGARYQGANFRDESSSTIPGSELWKNANTPAPFDQEFYITLGLGVGGRNDFGTATTPWERTSPQMTRQFYGAKSQWYPSWTDSGKSLEVKSVKIFAL